MKKTRIAAAFAATLALCAGAHAQNTVAEDNASQAAPEGTMSSDVNGSTTMPAEIVPGSVGASGTGSALPDTAAEAPAATTQAVPSAPTRAEVRAETASLARAGMIQRGELSTPFQDRGGTIGATSF